MDSRVLSTQVSRRLRLVSLTTSAVSGVHLQAGQLSFLRDNGVDVIAVSSPSPELQQLAEREKVEVFGVPMAREISLLADMISLIRLWCLFRRLKPDIVNAGTPKAGLLGMVASYLAGVPVRIYTQRGLRLETCSGLKLTLLTATERLACWCADRVLFVSHSLRAACLNRKLVRESKAIVIGAGSSNGVNAERIASIANSQSVRELGLRFAFSEETPVIGFVGRLTKDKGIRELYEAFEYVQQSHPSAKLLIVGDFETGDPVEAVTVAKVRSNPNVIITGFVKDASPYYHLMSVLAFPSYREGFPNVPLEAACAGVATVGFEATGTVDAIKDGVTGTIVPLGESREMGKALSLYLSDATLRFRHGTAAKERASCDFSPVHVWKGLLSLYRDRLKAHGYQLDGTRDQDHLDGKEPKSHTKAA